MISAGGWSGWAEVATGVADRHAPTALLWGGGAARKRVREEPEVLRVRVATAMLYGETDAQRERALLSDDPVTLPWIAAALDRNVDVLADLAP